MSFRTLLDRTVTVVPRVVTGTSPRGNDVLQDGDPIEGIPAARDLVQADEETVDRDQQLQRWLYFLPAFLEDGTAVELNGYARLVDAGETFEVVGRPELVARRRRPQGPHHWELTVESRA